jgi:hypothetical protein
MHIYIEGDTGVGIYMIDLDLPSLKVHLPQTWHNTDGFLGYSAGHISFDWVTLMSRCFAD